MAKRLSDSYRPGRRDWLKLRHRQTVELTVLGLVGGAGQPRGLVLGHPHEDGPRPVVVSLPLQRQIALDVATVVTPITGTVASFAFGLGGQDPVQHQPVLPTVPVEVLTDGVADAGRLRHGVRVVRVRHDLIEDSLGLDLLPVDG